MSFSGPKSAAISSAVLLFLIAIGLSACSKDWPAFRHDFLRSGGQINDSPLSDPSKVQSLHVVHTYTPPNAMGFRASPVVYKGVVYVGNGNGYLYALDADTLNYLWQYPAPGQPSLTQTWLSNPSSYGIASSATIATVNGTDAVIFGAPDRSIGAQLGSGRLFAIRADNGQEIWKSPELAVLLNDGATHEQIGYSSPLVWNNHVYIGIGDHGDDPIQRGRITAVYLSGPSAGQVDQGFSFCSTGAPPGGGGFCSTGPPRGGGVWGSAAGWDTGIFTVTGNVWPWSEPSPDNSLSMLRLDQNTGTPAWSWQPVPYAMDQDADWTATPTILLTTCGQLAVSTQKDGWAWAVNVNTGKPRWAFPPGPWFPGGFHPGDGTDSDHGDTRFIRPGAAWDDVYIGMMAGYNAIAPTAVKQGEGLYNRLYALNACADDLSRVRWMTVIPGTSFLGPPTVSNGIVFVGTDSGHLLVLADPTLHSPQGYRCIYTGFFGTILCSLGIGMVPDPWVLKDVTLAGPVATEPALANGKVYVSTDNGSVQILATDP